jgi:hypothetical protein
MKAMIANEDKPIRILRRKALRLGWGSAIQWGIAITALGMTNNQKQPCKRRAVLISDRGSVQVPI